MGSFTTSAVVRPQSCQFTCDLDQMLGLHYFVITALDSTSFRLYE